MKHNLEILESFSTPLGFVIMVQADASIFTIGDIVNDKYIIYEIHSPSLIKHPVIPQKCGLIVKEI